MADDVAQPDPRTLSGLEYLRSMITGQAPAPAMGRHIGFRLVEIEPGRALFEAEPGPHLLNPLGTVHGGFALTLIDSATGCAFHAGLDAGVGYATVETKVNFVRPIAADVGVVRCEGHVVSRGRQLGTAEARLITADGKLLAHGTSTLMVLAPRQ